MSESQKTYDDGLKFALESLTTEMIGALKAIVETPGNDPTAQVLPKIAAGLVAERLRYAKAESQAPAAVAVGA